MCEGEGKLLLVSRVKIEQRKEDSIDVMMLEENNRDETDKQGLRSKQGKEEK